MNLHVLACLNALLDRLRQLLDDEGDVFLGNTGCLVDRANQFCVAENLLDSARASYQQNTTLGNKTAVVPSSPSSQWKIF